jgi:hypothetical protein
MQKITIPSRDVHSERENCLLYAHRGGGIGASVPDPAGAPAMTMPPFELPLAPKASKR